MSDLFPKKRIAKKRTKSALSSLRKLKGRGKSRREYYDWSDIDLGTVAGTNASPGLTAREKAYAYEMEKRLKEMGGPEGILRDYSDRYIRLYLSQLEYVVFGTDATGHKVGRPPTRREMMNVMAKTRYALARAGLPDDEDIPFTSGDYSDDDEE